jgi:hypothetical protein
VSQALVPVDPAKRTVVTFAVKGDPWARIAAWAKRHRFHARSDSENTRLFQKGNGLLTSPMRAQFTRLDGGKVELQAWVHNLLFSRMLTLFLLPMEMNVRSGGFRAVVPRSIARKALNELLREMNATEIP